MIVATYDPEIGWSAPEVKPHGPITLDPACSCFQYGGNVFEGMKAYLGPDGKARLFRPDMNMRRLERSCARLALPVGTMAFMQKVILILLPHAAYRRRCRFRTGKASGESRKTLDTQRIWI
jgi:branched-subunit amino acid aminotransferase/4-amino-4-deoxychorismate lyase